MSEAKENRAAAKPRRQYDDAFKRRAVELSQRGDRAIGEVARELNLSEDALYRWRREYGVTARRGVAAAAPGPSSLTELQRENRAVRARLGDKGKRGSILKKT